MRGQVYKGVSIEICILTFKRPNEVLECLLSVKNAYEYYRKSMGFNPNINVIVREQSDGASNSPELMELINANNYMDLVFEDDIGAQKTILDFYWNFKADYGWFVSDDDLIDETAINIVTAELNETNPTLAMFNYDIFKKERKNIKIKKALGTKKFVCNKNKWLENFHIHPAMPTNVLLKRNILRKDIELTNQLLATEWAGLYIQYASFDEKFKGIFSPETIAGYRANNALQNYKWDFVFAKSVPELLRTLINENYKKKSISKAIRKTFFRYIIPEIIFCSLKLKFKISRLIYFYKNYLSNSKLDITYIEKL